MRISLLIIGLCYSLNLFAQEKKQITLEDIFTKSVFRSDMVAGFRSMKNGTCYSEINEKGDLQQVRFSDGEVEKIIAPLHELEFDRHTLKVDDYAFSDDESKLLLFCESENIYRRSVLNRVYVYDIRNGSLALVNEDKILHASFSPKGDLVAYVRQNNLWLFNPQTNETWSVTDDGSENILNGNCDWVYEEEFQFTRAYEWAPDGSYLAYYRFDQTDVPTFSFTRFEQLYPSQYVYKYPKAGEKNSEVRLYIYQIEEDKKVACDLGEETDIYIPRIRCNPFDNSLLVYRLNRLQNHLEFLRFDQQNGQSELLYEESNKAYIEIGDYFQFLKTRNAFLFTSEKSGYTHVYLFDGDSRKTVQLTKGNFDITDLNGVDETHQYLYYTSSEESSMERNPYRIGLNGEGKTLLCPEAGWHDVQYSRGFQYFMDRYSYLNHPALYAIRNSSGELIRVLKDNHALINKMKEYELSSMELIQVPNEAGDQLNAWIIKPTHMQDGKKYPLLMFQYSGPGSQQVMNAFSGRDYWWYQMLAEQGYIIACVDGRGTGYRGEAFKKMTYLQLGKYESDDQIAAARYFAKQAYVDPARIGIWGWSYGGFMSSLCLLKGADVFKAAIAVAPVTNWRYYDNIYTERYMRTPAENARGYDDNSPVNHAEQLKGNYLLIHGTADDNVHFQNSVMMIDALIKANKDFDFELYPNKNHSIYGNPTRIHLYRKLTRFIQEKV